MTLPILRIMPAEAQEEYYVMNLQLKNERVVVRIACETNARSRI